MTDPRCNREELAILLFAKKAIAEFQGSLLNVRTNDSEIFFKHEKTDRSFYFEFNASEQTLKFDYLFESDPEKVEFNTLLGTLFLVIKAFQPQAQIKSIYLNHIADVDLIFKSNNFTAKIKSSCNPYSLGADFLESYGFRTEFTRSYESTSGDYSYWNLEPRVIPPFEILED